MNHWQGASLCQKRRSMWNRSLSRDSWAICRVRGSWYAQPDPGLNMNTCKISICPFDMGILNLLQVPHAMQIDIPLKETSVRYISWNRVKFKRLNGFIKFKKTILGAVERTPDLVEAASLPDTHEIGEWPQGVSWQSNRCR